ncbi:FAD binding domain-containing protein [Candidatus Bipolaricaulota bacterium]
MLGDFEYKRIRSIEEGCQALADAAGEGAVLAGGTDLLVEIRNGLKSPAILIDCKRLDQLNEFDVNEAGSVIGASVPLNRLIEHPGFRTAHPALADSLASIGTYQLRNRATLIGNICNASPAADSAPVLLVLDAIVNVVGVTGPRAIPIRNFFAGVKRTTLKSDEIVTSIHLPQGSNLRTAFRKQQRIHGHDLAVVNVAGAYSPGDKSLRIAIGSCAPTPVLLEPIKIDFNDTECFDKHVIEVVQASVTPISDVRASASYRAAVLPVLVKRVLHELLFAGGGD